jgi:chemotaxis protein MotB
MSNQFNDEQFNSAMRRRPQLISDSSEWLITYSDVITLLLAFFVMLIAVSDINQGKVELLNEALAESVTNSEVETPLQDLYNASLRALEKHNMADSSELSIDKHGIKLELPSLDMYESASAQLNENAIAFLKDFAAENNPIIKDFYLIEIEGHTDDTPIHTSVYDSNWELSAARATNVVKYFIEENMIPKQLKASGFADSRPKQLIEGLDGDALKIARSINRRVVIHIRRD